MNSVYIFQGYKICDRIHKMVRYFFSILSYMSNWYFSLFLPLNEAGSVQTGCWLIDKFHQICSLSQGPWLNFLLLACQWVHPAQLHIPRGFPFMPALQCQIIPSICHRVLYRGLMKCTNTIIWNIQPEFLPLYHLYNLTCGYHVSQNANLCCTDSTKISRVDALAWSGEWRCGWRGLLAFSGQ